MIKAKKIAPNIIRSNVAMKLLLVWVIVTEVSNLSLKVGVARRRYLALFVNSIVK